MKTIKSRDLKERGFKAGDLYYLNFPEGDRCRGWYLVLGQNKGISLSADLISSHTGCISLHLRFKEISKVVLQEDLMNYFHLDKIAKFFRNYDEKLIEEISKEVTYKPQAKYINAVHFGSTKVYTWRIPRQLSVLRFKENDIVEVETMYGNQFVQITEVFTDDYEEDEKIKEVISLIKTDDLPF